MNETSYAAPAVVLLGHRKADLLGPLLLAAAVFLLVYGVELFNFGPSIDEEAATFSKDYGSVWLQQGRWGMALVTLILPNFEAIPLLSTVLFGAGLVFATWRALHDFQLTRGQAWLFSVVHVGFPVWLHIAQFNTLAAGFGFGIAAAAVGAGAVARGNRLLQLAGIAMLAFAAAVYQTLAVYALLYILFALHAKLSVEASPRDDQRGRAPRALMSLAFAGACWGIALLLYWLLQKASLSLVDRNLAYIGGFLKTDALLQDPAGVAASSAGYLRSVLGGRHVTYLHWGAGILFIGWLGLLPVWLLARDAAARRREARAWGLTLGVFLMGVVVAAAPILVSAATLPLRAHVAIPLLVAWTASRTGTFLRQRAPALMWAAIAYFCIVAASIGASLFYSDRVVRAADEDLLSQLIPAIEEASGKAGTGSKIPVTIAGTRAFPFAGQLQRAEVFGSSIFEHDGGNIYRVEFFMRLRGYDRVAPVVLVQRPDLVPDVDAMPPWPAKGSVRLVRGVVIVKLGRPTPQQLAGF